MQAERVATLYALAKPAYVGGTIIAGMLVGVLWDAYPPQVLVAWFCALLTVMLARVGLHWAYLRAPRIDRQPAAGAAAWERRFALGSLATAALWAYVPAALFPHASQLLEAAVVIIVGGVIIAGCGLSAASLRAVYALVTLPLIALTMQLALQPDSTHRFLALCIVLFGLIMMRMARDINRSLVDSLRERLRNVALLERVEATETRLRDAIESFPEGAAVWDAKDTLLVCNQTYARLYGGGRNAAELVGTPFQRAAANAWKVEHAAGRADDSGRAQWIEERVEQHRAGSGESRQFQGRDGRWRQGSTVKLPGGGWVGLVTDITALKRAQDAFYKVLAEEDMMLDTLPVGLAFFRRRAVTRCNRRLEQMLGYEPGELQGKSTQAWFSTPARWQEAGEGAYAHFKKGDEIMEGDARLVRKDGSRIWCRVLGRSIDSLDSEQSAIFTFADIDQRVAAEKALRESEEKLRLAVDAADLVYWEWDRDTGKVSWGAGPALPGAEAREWKDYYERVHPEDRQRYLAAVTLAWEKGEPYSAEYRVQGGDGAVTWISARGKTVSDASGRANRMIGVAQDVTARKASEDMVRFLAHHDPLTGLPNRRLLEDRLRQAVYQAERHGAKVAAMLVDLDDFKRVNDSAGHRAGDAVLREVASRLGGCVRKADTLARHGGDEFVIVLADIQTEADCRIVAEKILGVLEAEFMVDGGAYRLGASIGISIYPGDAHDREALLRNADAAMYVAKQSGRNQYCFYGK